MHTEPNNPYAPPRASLGGYDSHAEDGLWGDAPLADRTTRLLAKLLDPVAVGLGGGLFVAVGYTAQTTDWSRLGLAALGGTAILMLVGVLVANLLMLHRGGQTIGKWLLGIRIVEADGVSRAPLWRILLLRAFPVVVQAVPLVGVGVVMAWLVDPLLLFGEERRCLHDRLAGTTVVFDTGGDEAAGGGDEG